MAYHTGHPQAQIKQTNINKKGTKLIILLKVDFVDLEPRLKNTGCQDTTT